ncbi:hypothetical protein GKD14_16545, partial [Paeniclostridium sordellii]|nr:hypothetical protein [Paeniclostridium sordellii]
LLLHYHYTNKHPKQSVD